MATLQITIQSVCNANPLSGQLGGTSGKDSVQWQATAGNSYVVKMPGGVFTGQPNAFEVTITGTGFQPATALSLAANATAQTISNYIYQNGQNCAELTGDPPPDIIIESSPMIAAKRATKRPAKKAAKRPAKKATKKPVKRVAKKSAAKRTAKKSAARKATKKRTRKTAKKKK